MNWFLWWKCLDCLNWNKCFLVFRVWTQSVDVQHLIYWQGQRVCDALFIGFASSTLDPQMGLYLRVNFSTSTIIQENQVESLHIMITNFNDCSQATIVILCNMNIIVTATISAPMPLTKLWVIIAGSKKVFYVLPAFIFSLSALGLIHLFLKKHGRCLDTFSCCPSHNMGLVLHIWGLH